MGVTNKIETPSKRQLYKILIKGLSPHMKYRYSLPTDGKPGEWHEVEGPLVRCENGLHLTDVPNRLYDKKSQCFLAETDGEILQGNHEFVCRRVRLLKQVEWVELDPLLAISPAMELMQFTWDHNGEGMGHSWSRINSAMQKALDLAITCGFRFLPGDFKAFAKEFNSGYWISDGEMSYAKACGKCPNPSAYQSFETWKGRKPFIVRESVSGPLARLYVGAHFGWHVEMKAAINLTVTSFVDHPGEGKKPYVVACSYKAYDRNESRKVDKIFKITHDDIKAYHAAIKEHAKKSADKSEMAV